MTLAEELADLLRPAVRLISRTRSRIVIGFAVVITLLCGFAIGGAAVDDAAIARDPVVTTAEVLDGSTFFRTLVRFTTQSGQIVVPELGVAYPRSLQPGDRVSVAYQADDPDRVRVADRTALSSAWPLVLVIIVSWAILWPVARRIRRTR